MQYHLDVWTDNPTQGYVTGDGCHPQGTHTITAIARDGYASGLNITVTGATEGQLNIYDAMGRRVLSSNDANGTFTLPSTGVYIVRVGEHSSRKVVVLK